MIRSAASKVMWVGRATVFLVGLAVILALVFGAASVAFGADADFFKVGRTNLADSVSRLTKSGAGPALDLRVDSGPPLAVNRATRVTNLNADKVDGSDAPLWAVVNSSGTFDRAKGVATGSNARVSDGSYKVTFNRAVSECAYTATIDDGNSGEPSIGTDADTSRQVHVFTANSSGVLVDRAFQLVVFC
jgi:hypothetical protein